MKNGGSLPAAPGISAFLVFRRLLWLMFLQIVERTLDDVLFDPPREVITRERSAGNRYDDLFLFVDSGIDFIPVQNEHNFHRRVADAFIAVDEWVVRDQRMRQGRAFAGDRLIEIDAAKSHPWLSDSRVQSIVVANTRAATGLRDYERVQRQNLLYGEEAHQESRL
jgi:hypothetical protein